MADAKIEIRVGEVSFSGEGEGKWLSEQLDKILKNLPDLAGIVPAASASSSGGADGGTSGPKAKGTLAGFLKEKAATDNQIRKFLATAVWLHERTSKPRLATKDVIGALSDNHQKKLGNPADCLNQNVKKGFCEKDGKEFYVTDEGRGEFN